MMERLPDSRRPFRRGTETHETRNSLSFSSSIVSLTQSQQPTFKSGAKTVAVYATVAQKDGRLITDLSRDAFEIRDDGKPQPITVFSTEVQPISVVIMLDRSGSMRGNVGLVEQAAETFVKQSRPRRYGSHRHLRRTHRHSARDVHQRPRHADRHPPVRAAGDRTDAAVERASIRQSRRFASAKDARSCSSSATAATRR